MEEWKDIKDYENLYLISNLGRVKSLGNGKSGNSKEKILKPFKDKRGYMRVNLCKNGKCKIFLVHKLVAFAFVDGWFEGAEVDHIDTNRENNIWTNLRFVTHKENQNNELSKEHSSEAKKGKPKSEEHKKKISESKKKKIYCIELDKVFNSILEASKELNIDQGYISKVCNGKKKTAKGFHFRYMDNVV